MTEVEVVKDEQQWYKDGHHSQINDPHIFFVGIMEEDKPKEFPCLLVESYREQWGDFITDIEIIPLSKLGLTLPE